MKVPQTDPGAGYLARRERIDAAIAAVLRSGRYMLGAQVDAFEREFAAYLGIGHAIGVANGTDAVSLALRALGVGAGDRVATVSATAVATVAAIDAIGAVPVLVDIEARRPTMDPGHLSATLAGTPVSAVVVVHLHGQPARIEELSTIARGHGAAVVEDCAQSLGASLAGRRLGTFGDACAFSFYPTKNLGAFGDGGAVATGDATIAARVRALRQYGWGGPARVSESKGGNSRLDELQAAVLRVGLADLDADNAHRARIAARYADGLADAPIALPEVPRGSVHAWHQFVVRSPQRDALRAALDATGVSTAIHYALPVHEQPAYSDVPRGPGGLPQTERLSRSVLSLPMYPQLGDAALEHVIAEVARASRQLR